MLQYIYEYYDCEFPSDAEKVITAYNETNTLPVLFLFNKNISLTILDTDTGNIVYSTNNKLD